MSLTKGEKDVAACVMIQVWLEYGLTPSAESIRRGVEKIGEYVEKRGAARHLPVGDEMCDAILEHRKWVTNQLD